MRDKPKKRKTQDPGNSGLNIRKRKKESHSQKKSQTDSYEAGLEESVQIGEDLLRSKKSFQKMKL